VRAAATTSRRIEAKIVALGPQHGLAIEPRPRRRSFGHVLKLAGGWSLTAKFDGEYSKTTAIFAGSAALRNQW
jgi:hypothetical protein